MSDRPIQIGDLVMVVRSCCQRMEIGYIFKVSALAEFNPYWGCPHCKSTGKDIKVIADARFGINRDCTHAPLSWLKRIPPLSEMEGQRAQEDIKEPA